MSDSAVSPAAQVSDGSRPLHLYIRRSDADKDLGEKAQSSECVFQIQVFLVETAVSSVPGFAVMGHVDGGGRSHIFVSEVNPLGLSARKGSNLSDCLSVSQCQHR